MYQHFCIRPLLCTYLFVLFLFFPRGKVFCVLCLSIFSSSFVSVFYFHNVFISFSITTKLLPHFFSLGCANRKIEKYEEYSTDEAVILILQHSFLRCLIIRTIGNSYGIMFLLFLTRMVTVSMAKNRFKNIFYSTTTIAPKTLLFLMIQLYHQSKMSLSLNVVLYEKVSRPAIPSEHLWFAMRNPKYWYLNALRDGWKLLVILQTTTCTIDVIFLKRNKRRQASQLAGCLESTTTIINNCAMMT